MPSFQLNVKWFLIALAAGLLYVYLLQPAPRVVVKFPSPYTAGKITYRDGSDNCFTYSASKVSCPMDKSLIRQQPIDPDY